MIGADTTFLVQLELAELPNHTAAREALQREILDTGIMLVLAPQVLAEFIHVVTDPRRFQKPLTANEAITKARFWWDASEVRHVYHTEESMRLFLDWMNRFKLGRKRILDTQLAAMLWTAGARRIITSNIADFQLLGFDTLSP
jgi:predicted nucleic acid-binding protein